jgi:hypothetical protein
MKKYFYCFLDSYHFIVFISLHFVTYAQLSHTRIYFFLAMIFLGAGAAAAATGGAEDILL